MTNYRFVTVEGNTGAGKTSLAKMLSKEYDSHLVLEEFVDNPFLPKFYAEPERYAFSTEVFFLLDRHKQLANILQLIAKGERLSITDYVLNKTLLYAKVNLSDEEFTLFKRLFNTLYADLPSPELIIYIHSKVDRLIQNIKKRGRGFEQVVRPEYLEEVEQIYFDFFKANPQLKVLIIEADNLDFVNNEKHYQQILKCINKEYKQGMNFVSIG